MAAVMQRAVKVDEEKSSAMRSRLAELQTENQTLRELLKISYKQSREVTHLDRCVQVAISPFISIYCLQDIILSLVAIKEFHF